MQELPQPSVEKLSRVAKLLRTQRSLPAKLEAVVAITKRVTPGCDAVGVSLIIEGEPTTAAVSDRLAVEVDLVQYQTGEGPCLTAIDDSRVVRIDVVEGDQRFSRFAPGALAFDINSVLSIPLAGHDTVVGAMNLYSRSSNAFGDHTAKTLEPMAAYAGEVIRTSPLYAYSLEMVEGLMETLESRALIAQATGVMVASERLTGEEALNRLRDLALQSGHPMRTVAQWVLEERPTGSLRDDLGQASRNDEL